MTHVLIQDIKTALSQIKLQNGSTIVEHISDIHVTEDTIKFVIYADDVRAAQILKERAMQTLEKHYPNHQISIWITNQTKTNHIKKIVLVGSGKGGVGKSTIASYVAQKLALGGYKVGLLDADIYGPSVPTIFGIRNQKPESIDKLMIPILAHNVHVMSMGFFIDQTSSVPWRGPMISKAVDQLISQTYWGILDYLIIDMPPGTGDVHLTILQNHSVSTAIVVTLPQLLSIQEAEKLIDLYKRFNINIAMIVDNMSTNSYVSQYHGGMLAKKYDIKSHERVQFNPEIIKACEDGKMLTNIINLNLRII